MGHESVPFGPDEKQQDETHVWRIGPPYQATFSVVKNRVVSFILRVCTHSVI